MMPTTPSPNRAKSLVGCVLFLIVSSFSTITLGDQVRKETAKYLNLELTGQPMSEVAAQISQQLNYKVSITDELAAIKAFGSYKNVTLEEFFSRNIFREKNIVILYDDKEQHITITNFKSLQNAGKYNAATFTDPAAPLDDATDSETEVLPGVKLASISISEDYTDPTTIEASPGHTISEIPIQEEPDPSEIEITPGSTLGEVDIVEDTDPADIEVTPGYTVSNSSFIDTIDPQEIEVTPGHKVKELTKER